MGYNMKVTEYKDSIKVTHYNYEITEREVREEDDTDKLFKAIEERDFFNFAHLHYNPFINKICKIEDIELYGWECVEPVSREELKELRNLYNTNGMSHRARERYLKECAKQQEFSKDRSIRRTVNVIYDYARCNNWDWFLTFTFRDKELRYDYIECRKKVSKWLKNQREKNAPNLKYLVIAERHKDGAYHFHGLLSDIGNIKVKPATNYYTNKIVFTNSGKMIYNFSKFSYGFTTATMIEDTEKVSSYITKYLTKDLLDNVPNKQRYLASKSLEKPNEDKYVVDDVEGVFHKLLETYGYYPEVQHVKSVKNVYNDRDLTYYQMKL